MNESIDNEVKAAVLSSKCNFLILVIVTVRKRTVLLLLHAIERNYAYSI